MFDSYLSLVSVLVHAEQKESLSYVINVRFVGFSVFCGSSSNSDFVFEILASVCFWEFCSCEICQR